MNTPDQSTCARCGRTILRGLDHWFTVGIDGYTCGPERADHIPVTGDHPC